MINSLPSNFANAVTPYAPLGRQAVSEESTELKSTSFKPLEESAASARGANERSPEQRPGEVEERERTRINGESAEGDAEQEERDTDEGEALSRSERRELEQQQETIRELAARDREVRAHERAHAAVGGQYAGAPSYQYERGPDGVSYAVSGEVGIDASAVPGDPQATLDKAEQVQRAALAPAEPSAQDRRVAARASQLAVEARAEIQVQQREERRVEQEAAAEAREQQSEQSSVQGAEEDTSQVRESQAEEQQRREERAREFAEASARNIDINRRLIEIGVIEPPSSSGALLNQRV
ncbi:catalase [Gilvimarinus agarilyticus]|uniref:putative metalloprotease CJM1_0395 family protein n=1 Tax=Gilvimarinus sp. 2_MG-2023 TaxID=3062666 RepID=UPI001C08E360|nr:putative metalloprotease CJM1_0395 family protein [Gilvimarinus sp. 2_MG-2023]MBU2885340.1 catalase [Gilvimarinus agarilyticus]MDO6570239.1 putative metalloprotease CJM1_0395 family protein [Gilvimarinus sp. 2_MG-2023]